MHYRDCLTVDALSWLSEGWYMYIIMIVWRVMHHDCPRVDASSWLPEGCFMTNLSWHAGELLTCITRKFIGLNWSWWIYTSITSFKITCSVYNQTKFLKEQILTTNFGNIKGTFLKDLLHHETDWCMNFLLLWVNKWFRRQLNYIFFSSIGHLWQYSVYSVKFL